MQLSIIIVNYRSAADISNCIQSAMHFASWQSFEWIVVDNDSKDNSKEVILSAFPFVRWIEMGYNAGFARGNNEGIRQARGEVVLLLNPDTIILDDALDKCFQQFIQTNYIACAAQLLNADKSPQITGNFFMKGGLNHLLPLPYLGRLLRSIAFAAKVKKTNVQQSSEEEIVDWINGAFLMVKKSAIAKAGMLDEDFFLYAEEIEWCSRLKKQGELCVFGDINVIHLQGETINKATKSADKGYFNLYDRKGLQIMLSNLVRICKEFGVGWFLFILLVYTATIPVFLIVGFVHNLFTAKRLSHFFSQWIGFTKNVFFVWKWSGTIISNKPHFYKVL